MIKTGFSYAWTTLADNFLIKFFIGILLAVLTKVYGQYTELINMMLILFVIDFMLGLFRSIINKRTSSQRAFVGGLKFLGYCILLYVGHAMDLAIHMEGVFTAFFLGFILLRDSISIIENLHLLGFNVPIQVVQYLHIAQTRLQEKLMTSLGISQMEPDAIQADDTSSIDHKKDEHIDNTNPEP